MTTDPGTATHLGLSADEVLTTTRAVRKRLDFTRPVPREVIDECIRIAVQAPSGRNRQQWDFIFVEDQRQRAVVADIWRHGLMAPYSPGEGRPAPTRMSFESKEWMRIASSLDHLVEHLHEAPLLLIPCLRIGDRTELRSVREQAGAWGSVIPAIWSFMLAARERGLGTAWTTCHLSYEEDMAEVLGIDYSTVIQAALTPIAYTLGTNFKPGPRADHHSFIHWDRW